MESVAAHINEMQKIYEEFGAVFDDLSRSSGGSKEGISSGEKRALELNLGDMQVKHPQLLVFAQVNYVVLPPTT